MGTSQPRLRRPPVWLCSLALSAAMIALHYAFEPGSLAQALVYSAVGIVAAAAVVAGILWLKPARTVHLWFFALGLGLLAAGDATWNAYDFVLKVERPYPSVADAVYLAGYLSFALAMLFLIRSRQRPSVSDVLDGAIVLCGAALLLWFALIESAARDASVGIASRIVSSAYPAFDVLLIAVLVQLLLTGGGRSTSFRLIALGTGALLATDIVYGLQTLAGTYAVGSWLDAGWMINVSLFGAAALHPSIRSLHEHAPLRQTNLTTPRLLLLAAATLVTPLVIVLYLQEEDAFDVALIAGVAGVTTLFVFVRMALLFREHTGAVVALRDAIAKRDVDQALHVSNERFQAAARALECAIYEWNAETGETLWTEGIATAFQHPVQDTRRTGWFLEQIHPDDRDRVTDIFVRAEGGARERDAGYRFRAGDGTYREVWDRWITARGDDGKVERIVGGLVDVTDRHELERLLQQSQKMEAVGRLAGGIAHDFNNLLMAISGSAELLQLSPSLGAEDREDVAQIVGAAGRATELTRQLLTFSRADPSVLGSIDLNCTVAGMQSLLTRLLGTDIEIVASLDEAAGSVVGTASGLEQIVLNLAINARDAMPEGGSLLLSTHAAPVGGEAMLVVEDTGAGMEAQIAGHIFEPFFTTKEIGKGTGLGLATVYGVVQQFGGTITVASRPGVGTRFEVLLPCAQASPEVVSVPVPHDGDCSEQILLVEDEPGVRAIVLKMLARRGYDVVAAAGPLEALELLERDGLAPDLVVSDLMMPGLTGRQFAERVQALRPGTAFLFISGFSGDTPLPARGGRAQTHFLQKPFTADEVAHAVRSALDDTVAAPVVAA